MNLKFETLGAKVYPCYIETRVVMNSVIKGFQFKTYQYMKYNVTRIYKIQLTTTVLDGLNVPFLERSY